MALMICIMPNGLIKEIQEKAEKIFGSKKSFILVNGSTCGILAGIRSAVKNKDKILVARNCHKSVYHAIEINDLEPIYLSVKINEYGIAEKILPKDVEKTLNENEDIKLLVLTSPTYEGMISNLKEIVKIAHKYNVPVLVDEAHGAHLKFMSNNTHEAINAGADIVIQSLHKTLPALTQCAILHIQGEFIKKERVQKELTIFETSSPSYILMASIDECLNILESKGRELFEKYEQQLNDFYRKSSKLQNLLILGNYMEESQFYDYGKIVIITKKCNLNGVELAEILRKKYKIETEMSGIDYVIAMTSICDKQENFEKVLEALFDIDKTIKSNKTEKQENLIELKIPKRKMTIQKAIEYEKTYLIDYKEAEGYISKEYMWVYPPGVPIITPGEIIDEHIISKLKHFEESKKEVRTDLEKFPKVAIIKI